MNVDERTSCRKIPLCRRMLRYICWNALGARITVFENYTQVECISINDYDERNCNCFTNSQISKARVLSGLDRLAPRSQNFVCRILLVEWINGLER